MHDVCFRAFVGHSLDSEDTGEDVLVLSLVLLLHVVCVVRAIALVAAFLMAAKACLFARLIVSIDGALSLKSPMEAFTMQTVSWWRTWLICIVVF